ncbi:MAG: hypothetical protein V3V47_01810, partial [Desulfobacteria bacterium]
MKTIHVTADDIRKGIKGSPYYCPVSIAVKRAFKVHHAFCAKVYIDFDLGRVHMAALTPVDAEAFMKAFDTGELVKP